MFASLAKITCLIEPRRIPYPYTAMLAICSDLDETRDADSYRQLLRYLNTEEATPLGPGVGLEAANSLYFEMPQEQFAYWNTDDAGRAMVREYIRSGHIDSLHSYGDHAFSRRDAARALNELNRHGCRMEVWVDHGTSATNFGSDIMHGHGDDAGHEAYHADLTTMQGVKYVWRGRVSSVMGQDRKPDLMGLYRINHPLTSTRTAVKETAKHVLARCGNSKYAMHGPNHLMRRTFLRDGAPVYEFMRSSPHWAGITAGEDAHRLGEVLSDENLSALQKRHAVCILYTHLGRLANHNRPLPESVTQGLMRLFHSQRAGKILVTTTRRLLGFCRAVREVEFSYTPYGDHYRIDLLTKSDVTNHVGELGSCDLDGLTLYMVRPERARVFINGRETTNIIRNKPDETGQSSISLPWPKLEFPKP